MSYLVMGNGGGRIRVRAPLQAAKQVARELALYSGASVVLEHITIPEAATHCVVAQFVRRGKVQVVAVTTNINKEVRV